MYEVIRKTEDGRETTVYSFLPTMSEAIDLVQYCYTCNFPEGTVFTYRKMVD